MGIVSDKRKDGTPAKTFTIAYKDALDAYRGLLDRHDFERHINGHGKTEMCTRVKDGGVIDFDMTFMDGIEVDFDMRFEGLLYAFEFKYRPSRDVYELYNMAAPYPGDTNTFTYDHIEPKFVYNMLIPTLAKFGL